MTTAAGFATLSQFPFCVEALSGVSNLTYIDNLTIADIMAFGWNFETFTITTNGTATLLGRVADGSLYITLSPISSDVLTDAGTGASWGGDMWFGATIDPVVPFASFPNIRQPVERVCFSATKNVLLELFATDGTINRQWRIAFYVGTDPVNSGKYRLYYWFSLEAIDPPTGTVVVRWSNNNVAGGDAAFSSGTITLAGLTFNWYSFYTAAATTGGTGAMTASSTSFTY